MKVTLNDGRYVIAVSGGVDSVVLLDLITEQNKHLVDVGNLMVAHFDHGIREDSEEDAKLVESLAKKYGLPFVLGRAKLGHSASEAMARQARYNFLFKTLQDFNANAIITAHHKDDLLETAIINLTRGTGRHGLSALDNRPQLLRPLLEYKKSEILKYAEQKQLSWREDSTNLDTKYLRNKIRIALQKHAKDETKNSLLVEIAKIRELNLQIDKEVDKIINSKLRGKLSVVSKKWLIHLPYNVACEIVYAILRKKHIENIDSKLVDKIVTAICVAKPGKKIDINKSCYILITKRSARFIEK